MQRALVVGLPLLASCMMILPTDRRKDVHDEDHWDAPRPVGQPQLAMSKEVRDTWLVMRGIWMRTCEQGGEHVTTARVERGARFKLWACGDDGCEYLAFFGLVAAPFTLLISGVVTAIDVKSTPDHMDTKTTALAPHRARCDLPAKGWNLVVTAPGREPIAVTTDEQGIAQVDLGDAQLARAATVAPATSGAVSRAR